MMDYTAAEGLEMGVPCVELYVDDPASTPEDRLRTDICMSLA